MKLFCASCNEPLRSRPEVGRGGELVDLVRPCARCVARIRIVQRVPPPVARPRKKRAPVTAEHRAKMGNRYCTKRNAAGELVCIICGAPLDVPKKSGRGGRLPVFCAAHKDPASRQDAA